MAAAGIEKPKPVLPSEQDAQLAAESSRILSSLAEENEFRVRLESGVTLRLPSAVKTLLTHLLTEMSRGNAVTVIPIHAELTTQEAATFLNVSRPYLISLLNRGQIPFHMTGTHRKIKFADITAYKERRARESEEVMAELARQAQEFDIGY